MKQERAARLGSGRQAVTASSHRQRQQTARSPADGIDAGDAAKRLADASQRPLAVPQSANCHSSDVFVRAQELMDSEPLPSIQQSIDAFRRDLPELLQKHHGKVAPVDA